MVMAAQVSSDLRFAVLADGLPPSPHRRVLAHAAANGVGPRRGAVPDDGARSVPTVVSTLSLCAVPDLSEALARIRGELEPDGQLLFFEHVHTTGAMGRLQTLAAPAWRRFGPGCAIDRDLTGALRAAGFRITDCDRFTVPALSPLAQFVVEGRARPR